MLFISMSSYVACMYVYVWAIKNEATAATLFIIVFANGFWYFALCSPPHFTIALANYLHRSVCLWGCLSLHCSSASSAPHVDLWSFKSHTAQSEEVTELRIRSETATKTIITTRLQWQQQQQKINKRCWSIIKLLCDICVRSWQLVLL